MDTERRVAGPCEVVKTRAFCDLPPVRWIGLTGGVASGKSTVAGMFRQLGVPVVDADAVYHALVAPRDDGPSPLARRIDESFPGVLEPSGRLDRKALAERVFSDARARRRLESIAHPEVAREVAIRRRKLEEEGAPLAFYDVPLLFERGLEDALDGVVVVWVPESIQVERLRRRDGLSEQAARARLAAQLPLDEKRRRATWVIDNSGSLDATRRQVEHLWEELVS